MRLAALASSTLFTLATAVPVLETRFVEETPWHLTKFFAFTAAPGPDGVSAISFHFCDTNAGIEMETECSRTLPPGSGRSPVDPDTYYPCKNATVRFQFKGDTIDVARSYKDSSVGPPGLDVVTAFGSANTTLQIVELYAGTKAWSKSIDVPITALIA
ncbi:hypothetical protein B0A49_08185 [Cryomyces minteri]|uniref:AA1-like domain-containing protein n=1 Tax=Cryomyces minteri TaxID=331657 RepID=A0A4U0WQF2_9PEZI|nr:hypothetical protein B0A49_08185 [Cryomyces minteri]